MLSLLECRSNKLVGETDFITIVKNLENFHFIFSNVCQSRASGIEGTYTRAAKNLYAAKEDKAKVKEVLKKLNSYLIDKRPKNQIISESVAGLSFTKGNDLNKKTIQTIFIKVEHHLQVTSELGMQNFSLEHILDQSCSEGWIGKVGNLLPLDGSLNNGIREGSTFKAKKTIYRMSSLKTVNKFLELNDRDKWDNKSADIWESFIVSKLDDATKIMPI
ncbi:GmrSD restriction endonuclease domain-containing protein [Azospirillum argentinense]|uniref:GmrSD restriction endonuclease domain-containing protein n=1 Tax=Azospirillum argentinense TaxID=2970906 RepID=UPI00190A8DA2|nr:DUF1524 domain-containing protein [Azospirillum argentinense]